MNHQKAIKGLLIALIALGVIAGVVAYSLFGTYFALKANPMSAFTNTSQGALASDDVNYDANAHVETVQIDGQTYQKKNGVISILMLGIDWDGTEQKDATGARSDMLMLCTIDTETNDISFLSIPRDTRTVVHKVDQKTGKVEEKEYMTKINHIHPWRGKRSEPVRTAKRDAGYRRPHRMRRAAFHSCATVYFD